ncbi:MAG: hypothetical protein HY787_11950 [Deltaproteobacteria bacterium]|nr:hypothetical protein [Deltaproteobacteria bacterium]
MPRGFKVLFLILLLLNFSACASKTMDLLKSRTGQMNFEEAIQRFGPPARCAEAGTTKSCLWVMGSFDITYVPVGRHFVPVPTDPPSLRLTFINGIMSQWELRGFWE